MKILLYGINYAPEPVGIGKYTGELGAWLTERGHQVRGVTAPPYFPEWQARGNRYRRETVCGVTIWRSPLWVPRRPNGLTRLLHLASFAISSFPVLLLQWRWQPNVIICVAPAVFCAPGALILGRLCGEKTVTWLHIQDFELDAAFELEILKGERLRRWATRWERRTLRGFTRVSSISKTMLRHAISKGVSHEKTVLLPNWVDLNEIRPQTQSERKNNIYRRGLGLKQEDVVLLYSGSMNKKQGLDVVIESIKGLQDHREIIWILAGEGPEKASLEEITRGLAQVRIMPLQPAEHLNEWLNLADIHILPQRGAAADLVLPSKLLGILASGKPVVATSPAGSTLRSIAEEAGICVNPGDARAFAEAIKNLATDEKRRLELGMNARLIAEKEFDKEAVLEHFESYLNLL